MTGGTARVAYVHEDAGFADDPDDDDYKTPGLNGTVDELSFENDLTRQRNFGVETEQSVEGTFEGTFSVSFDAVEPWWLTHVFGDDPDDGGESDAPYSYTWSPVSGEVQSSRWYVGIDPTSGTVERVLKGVVFPQAQIECSIGDPVNITLTGVYADEEKDTEFTPGEQPSPDADPLIFHGGELSIPESTDLARMQSATLNLEMNTRYQRGWDRIAEAAVIGAVDPTIDVTKIITETDLLELAYGSEGDNSPQDTVDGATDGSLAFTTPGDNSLTFEFDGVTPQGSSWDNFGDPDSDAEESPTLNIDRITAVAESSEAEAR